MRDCCQPGNRRQERRIGGGRDVEPQARLDVKSRIQIRVGDLLEVSKPGHRQVCLEQPPIRDVSRDDVELYRFGREVDLEEAAAP